MRTDSWLSEKQAPAHAGGRLILPSRIEVFDERIVLIPEEERRVRRWGSLNEVEDVPGSGDGQESLRERLCAKAGELVFTPV